MDAPLRDGDVLAGLVLALDAGSPLVSVAVGSGGRPQAVRAVALERSSTQLLSLIDQVLAEIGARPADLQGIVALAGPGSFTGLRVGLATALGLHQALGIRALALPTLTAMAAAALAAAPAASVGGDCSASDDRGHSGHSGHGEDLVIAAVDALRGEWSAQAFRGGEQPRPLGPMTLVPAAAVPVLAARTLPPGVAVGGAPRVTAFGVAALRDAAQVPVPAAVFVESPALAATALALAARVPVELWRADQLAAPIYSRPPATTAPRRRP